MKKPKKSKKTLGYISLTLLILITIGVLTIISQKPEPEVTATTKTEESGVITINKADITKTATFVPVTSNGTYMELIAIRASDDTVRTALNTCQVCYASGRGYYEQLGDVLICNNCGNQFTIDQIEVVKGGCNPVPVLNDMKDETEDTITIQTEALAVFEPLFANWK